MAVFDIFLVLLLYVAPMIIVITYNIMNYKKLCELLNTFDVATFLLFPFVPMLNIAVVMVITVHGWTLKDESQLLD